jgi:predicted nucleic acid-binding protein
MPGVEVFVDTNILLYIHDRDSDEKGGDARAWLDVLTERQCARINLQVQNELTFVLLKRKWFDTAGTVFGIVDQFSELGSSALTAVEIRSARELHVRYRYAWWDCLLLASALELGCTHFLSEDLQDGQVIQDGAKSLTIVDPFAHTPGQILVSG